MSRTVKRKIRSVKKQLTPAERVRHAAVREQIEREKAELIARGRRVKLRHARLREVDREHSGHHA